MPKLKDFYDTSGLTKTDLINNYIADIEIMFKMIGQEAEFIRMKNVFIERVTKDLEDGSADYDDGYELKNGLTVYKISYDAVHKTAKRGNRAFEKLLRSEFGIKKHKKKSWIKKAVGSIGSVANAVGKLVVNPEKTTEAMKAIASGNYAEVADIYKDAGKEFVSDISKEANKKLSQYEKDLKKQTDYINETTKSLRSKGDSYIDTTINETNEKLKGYYEKGKLKYNTAKNELSNDVQRIESPIVSFFRNFFSSLFDR